MKYFVTVLIFTSVSSSQLFAQFFTDFTAEDLNGNEIKFSSFVEKGPVMLSFWRSFCSSCKEEQKNMQVLFEQYKDKGFTYIGVNIDNQRTVSKVKSYISTMGFTFPVILDTDKKVFEMYGGREETVPYYLIIGKDKKILITHLGYISGDEKMIEREIKEALGIK
jgi:peroxiredoxin